MPSLPEDTQMEPVAVTALPVQGWDPFLLLLCSTTNQTSRWRGGFAPQKHSFVFWIKYTRYHTHFKLKDMFQKPSTFEITFPVLSAHHPNKTEGTRKGMPLAGRSERRNNPPYHALACLWVCHYESLAACHVLYLLFCCVWSLILRDKQKKRWKSSWE